MNTIYVSGNLARDAEKKEFGENTLFEFSVAVNGASDKKQEDSKFYESAFFRVKFWTKNPDKFEPLLVKGNRVMLSGSLKEAKWEKEGVPMSMIYINAQNVDGLVKLSGGSSSDNSVVAPATSKSDEFDPFA